MVTLLAVLVLMDEFNERRDLANLPTEVEH